MIVMVDGVDTDVPAGWEPFTYGHRRAEQWVWRLLDLDDNVLGELDGVEGGGLVYNVHADTRGSGRLQWSGLVADMPTWRYVRIQPIYRAELPANADHSAWHAVEWRAGVFMCSAPTDAYTEVDVSVDVQLFDKTLVLRRAKLTDTFAVAAGVNVVTTVRNLLSTYVTGTDPIIEDSTATLRSPMAWEAGDSILKVVNELLAAINYFAVWADGNGVLRSTEYDPPSARPLSWEFAAGATALHAPEFEHDHDDFETYNRVTLVSRADGEVQPLKSIVALDDIDPAHPLSWNVTGEWVDYFEADIEAANQATLDALALRKLTDNLGTSSTYKIVHAPMPLPMNGRVTFTRPGGAAATATVQETSFECAAGADYASTLREVVG